MILGGLTKHSSRTDQQFTPFIYLNLSYAYATGDQTLLKNMLRTSPLPKFGSQLYQPFLHIQPENNLHYRHHVNEYIYNLNVFHVVLKMKGNGRSFSDSNCQKKNMNAQLQPRHTRSSVTPKRLGSLSDVFLLYME